MPNSRSAEKRLRNSIKDRARNRIRRTRIRTTERKFREALASGSTDEAKTFLGQCFSVLDRAAKTGAIHQNTADRKKSRLTATYARATESEVPAAVDASEVPAVVDAVETDEPQPE